MVLLGFLVSEGALEHLRLELAPQQLPGLVLWQRLHKHHSGGEPESRAEVWEAGL